MSSIDEKYEALKQFILDKGKNGAVIAFSGGVDSATLAAVCHILLMDKAVAATAQSSTYTTQEMKEAQQIAQEIGIKQIIIQTKEIANPEIVKNPPEPMLLLQKRTLNQTPNNRKKTRAWGSV
jgi:uncharacterized protein